MPELRGWEVNETYNENDQLYTVTLLIQGRIHKQTHAPDITDAYRQLVDGICPELSRAVTVATLLGGKL